MTVICRAVEFLVAHTGCNTSGGLPHTDWCAWFEFHSGRHCTLHTPSFLLHPGELPGVAHGGERLPEKPRVDCGQARADHGPAWKSLPNTGPCLHCLLGGHCPLQLPHGARGEVWKPVPHDPLPDSVHDRHHRGGGCRGGGGGCPVLPKHDTWCCQPRGVCYGGCGLPLQLGCSPGCLQRGMTEYHHWKKC